MRLRSIPHGVEGQVDHGRSSSAATQCICLIMMPSISDAQTTIPDSPQHSEASPLNEPLPAAKYRVSADSRVIHVHTALYRKLAGLSLQRGVSTRLTDVLKDEAKCLGYGSATAANWRHSSNRRFYRQQQQRFRAASISNDNARLAFILLRRNMSTSRKYFIRVLCRLYKMR